ncbi:type IV secretion system protein [Trinickia acidisoli]|uniref:type IV secretion system protein n=1 Tax=Trinickia acidisoli TaxID=2767482 RepID=UPI001A8C9F42|nr:type IV secretion system protein [Trinickia acidisoli]
MSFFADLGTSVTSQATGLADQIALSLVSAIEPLFVTATALTLLFHGLALIRGESQQAFGALLWKTFKVGIILGVLSYYIDPNIGVVVNVIGIQSGLVTSITNGQASSAFQMVDQAVVPLMGFFAGLMIFGISMISGGSMGNITIGLLIFTFIILGGGALALALFYALLSTLGLAIVLGLGPLFIAGLAFGPTARYFEGWLSSVFSFLLLGAVSSVVLGFVMATEGNILVQAFPNVILGAFQVTMVSFVFLLFMLEVPRLVSQLTSGGADVTSGVVGFAQIRGIYGAPWLGAAGGGIASVAERAVAAGRVGGR